MTERTPGERVDMSKVSEQGMGLINSMIARGTFENGGHECLTESQVAEIEAVAEADIGIHTLHNLDDILSVVI